MKISNSECQIALDRIPTVLHCMILFVFITSHWLNYYFPNWKSKLMFGFWEYLLFEKLQWSQSRFFLTQFHLKTFNLTFFVEKLWLLVLWSLFFFFKLFSFLSITHCDFSALHSKVLFFVCGICVVQEKICIESEWNVWSAFYPQLACDEALSNCSMLFNINFQYANSRITFFSGFFAGMHKPMTVSLLADSHKKSVLRSGHLNLTHHFLLSDLSASHYLWAFYQGQVTC